MKPEDSLYQQFFTIDDEILESYSGREFVGWFIQDKFTGDYVKDEHGSRRIYFTDGEAAKAANDIARQMIEEADKVLLDENIE